MSLDALLADLEARTVTLVTAGGMPDVTLTPTEKLDCTAVTLVTVNNTVPARDRLLQNVAAGILPLSWNVTDWQEYFDERAAIAEYVGDMKRDQAERQAYESCIVRWLDTHPPVRQSAAICPYCQQHVNSTSDLSVPALTGDGGHVWLHDRCLQSWRTARRREAVKELAKIGITK